MSNNVDQFIEAHGGLCILGFLIFILLLNWFYEWIMYGDVLKYKGPNHD